MRPRSNRRHVADDIFKCIFENENEWISHRISLKFVPKVRINNIQALVQIMAWRRPGDKPWSEPMMVSLLTHICVTRPQWVNSQSSSEYKCYDNKFIHHSSHLIMSALIHVHLPPYIDGLVQEIIAYLIIAYLYSANFICVSRHNAQKRFIVFNMD